MSNADYKPTSYGSADFTPLAELAQPVDYLDHTIPLGRTNFPTIDALKIGMACMCEEEIMELTGIVETGVTVKRGCADTRPWRHPKNALIWFFDVDTTGTDGVEHSAGETQSIKYSPYTMGNGELPIFDSEIDTVTYNWRFYRPYVPGAMKARGARWWEEQTLTANNPSLLLTWNHRNRVTQNDQLVDHDSGNVRPEAGQTYTARIYDANGNLKRTQTDIMSVIFDRWGNLISPSWNYTWQQAMMDFGFENPAEEGGLVSGHIDFCTTRDGFDSWQNYRIDIKVDTQGFFIKAAQLASITAQPPTDMDDPGTPTLNPSLYEGQLGQMTAQAPTAADTADTDGGDGMFVTQIAQPSGSETNFYTTLNRNLFEAPYGFLAGRDGDGNTHKLVTVAARPSDRLTDTHDIWARYDWPAGTGNVLSYVEVDEPMFTPWATLILTIAQMDTTVNFDKTSFVDGVTLTSVQPGQIALIDAEFIRIETVDLAIGRITIARGCYDTVPAQHAKGSRIWFVDAHHGNDPTAYPERLVGGVMGAAVQVKMRPKTYGVQLNLLDVPTDRLEMKQRVQRPYPPGQVMVNGRRWFLGAIVDATHPARITWVHRNRLTQDAQIIDHDAPDQGAESGQQYKLKMSVWIKPKIGPSYEVIIREIDVDGTSFDYTWEMAKLDGYRAGAALGVCGRVTVGLTLYSLRDKLTSWQGYIIPLLLPSYTCPPGQRPGGGQLPPTTGGGNGETGEDTPGGSTGGDNTGDGPGDPVDNGQGDNGNGPAEPPKLPPEWPDPVDPPPEDPNDPHPELAAHWDLNWDRHWDAYTKDNQGN